MLKEKFSGSPSMKLPLKGSQKILGFGTQSMGMRVNDEKPNQSFVAVINKDVKKATALYHKGERIRKLLSDFTQTEYLIIGGEQKEPLAIKISPEIPGGTLNDIGFFYAALNPQIRGNLIKFGHKALTAFMHTGVFVDLWGRPNKNQFDRLRIAATPFNTTNLMVNTNTNEITLVDSGIESSDIWSESSLKHKGMLAIQAVSLTFWLGILHGLEVVNRNNKEVRQRSNKTESNEFLTGIGKIIQVLEQSGVRYAIVGSVAITAWKNHYGIEETLTPKRTDGTKRDIDIIIFSEDQQSKDLLLIRLNEVSHSNPNFPEVALVATQTYEQYKKKEDKKIGRRIKAMYTIPVLNNKNLAQAYDDMILEGPSVEKQMVNLSYKGISIATFKPEVLAGLSLIRGGAIKFKDVVKIANLLKITNSTIPLEFIDFAREIRIRHAADYKQFLRVEATGPVRNKIRKLVSSAFHI